MVKSFLLFPVNILIASNSFGLDKNDKSETLKRKIYVDKNKNVYTNYKAPLYLRLSTSPDEKGSSVLWYNEGSKDKSKSPVPMDFKNPGMHKIAHFTLEKTVDPSTTFRLYLDSKGPKIKYRYNNVPSYYDGKDLYMGEPVKLTLITKDRLSGVHKTFLSINDRPFQEYNAPFTFNKEKSTL